MQFKIPILKIYVTIKRAAPHIIWGKSDPQILSRNADEYLKMMELADANTVYNQVPHNGHILVELKLKAAFAKHKNGKHPWGHEIFKLLQYEINGIVVADKIMGDPQAIIDFTQVSTAWDMQWRYKRNAVSRIESSQLLGYFKGAANWIKREYVV